MTRQRLPWEVIAVFGAAWLQWMLPTASGAPLVAATRLAIAIAAVVFLPGAAVIHALGWFADTTRRERVCLNFAIGFGMMSVLHILAVSLHLSIAQSFAALTVATVGISYAARRGAAPAVNSPRIGLSPFAIVTLIVFVACGWLLEAKITGEETVELISIRKIADNPSLSLDGIMPEPHAVPTYVITPYYFFVAAVSKAAGVSLFVAYLKLRALYVAIAVLTAGALAGRLFPTGGEYLADAVMAGILSFFVADPDPWTWPASMFPLIRRGGVSAGVVAPTMMLALLVYAATPLRKARAEWIAPGLLLLALLTTHAMEIIYLGFFGVATVVSALCVRRGSIAFSRIVQFGIASATVAVIYRLAHSRLAAHVYAFDRASQEQVLVNLKAEFAQGLSSLGGISEAGKYLWSASGSAVPFTLLGIVVAPLLMRIDPAGGVLLWAAAAIPLVVYSSSKLFALLQLSTSSEILFVFAYFTLCGVLALISLTYFAVARTLELGFAARLRGIFGGVIACAIAALIGSLAALVLRPVASAIVSHPLILVWSTVGGGLFAVATLRNRQVDPRSTGGTVAALASAALILGLAIGFRGFPGYIEGSLREPLPQTMTRALGAPSVLDWPSFYPILQAHARPQIDLPPEVVSDLTALLPPLQTMIADPAHSFSLPVMLNQHIVNPGHVISTSLPYFERYARIGTDGARHHPVFNDDVALSEEELRFLDEYKVEYVLVNPPNRLRVCSKLDRDASRFERVYDRSGFTLYRIHLKRS